ncbi:MAG: hypothetical protein Q8Q04_03715 [archaeon]|nr:hypothetical protein [archaeon]
MVKKNNKKGWIKIVEAFLAVVFLLGILMIILTQYHYSDEEKSLLEENNYEILVGIETNISLRNSAFTASLPSYSNESGFPLNLKTYLDKNMLKNEFCFLYICSLDDVCLLKEEINKDVYSSEILLFSSTSSYSPRKLKVFCYFV